MLLLVLGRPWQVAVFWRLGKPVHPCLVVPGSVPFPLQHALLCVLGFAATVCYPWAFLVCQNGFVPVILASAVVFMCFRVTVWFACCDGERVGPIR